MSAVTRTLANLGYEEPSWLHPVENVSPADPADVAEFLNGLDDEDFGLFVLAHGMGMRLGEVSQSLRIDPALVIWRMRRALRRAHEADGALTPAMLELGIVRLLRDPDAAGDVPPSTRGDGTWAVAQLVELLDEAVQRRIEARLNAPPEVTRPGIGVGVIVLVLVFAAGFMIFGAIRDVNPLWRGKDLMAEGRFEEAMLAFDEHWDVEAAQEQIALCHLALGDFERAVEVMAQPGVVERFGPFAPVTEPLEKVDHEEDSVALLPRGLVRNARPTFVFRSGPPSRLHVRIGWHDQQVDRLLEVPDTRDGPAIARFPYPTDWPELPDGTVVWAMVPWVEDADGLRTVGTASQAYFQVLDRARFHEFRSDAARFLDSVPQRAHEFFLGQYLMRKGLYADAGEQFARLTRSFPGSSYPREMIDKVATALGVEPSAFLR